MVRDMPPNTLEPSECQDDTSSAVGDISGGPYSDAYVGVCQYVVLLQYGWGLSPMCKGEGRRLGLTERSKWAFLKVDRATAVSGQSSPAVLDDIVGKTGRSPENGEVAEWSKAAAC